MDELEECLRRFRAAPSEATCLAALAEVHAGSPGADAAAHELLRWALRLPSWTALSESARKLVDDQVALLLRSTGFAPRGIESFRLGEVAHSLPVYVLREHRFVLVPGGPVRLGVDRKALEAHQAVVAVQTSLGRQLGDAPRAQRLVATVLDGFTPARSLEIPPLLVEADSMSWPGYEYFGVDLASDVNEWVAVMTAFRTAEGARLATNDEWEWLCGGGSTSLFRWGNTVPADQLPAHALKPGSFSLHRERNAFGLRMAGNSQDTELCALGRLRGGDGYLSDHLGHQTLAWLTLATSCDSTGRMDDLAGLGIDEYEPGVRLVRPVL